MKTLGRKHKANAEIYNAYFEACRYSTIYQYGFEKKDGSVQIFDVFIHKGFKYAVRGYDHFNGHISGYTDKSAVYDIYVSKIIS